MKHTSRAHTESPAHGSVFSYTTGFILSIIFSFAAYYAVVSHQFNTATTIVIIVALAVAQLGVQLFCFLHLGQEEKPQWNLVALVFAIVILGIVVAGTLWIMYNLNYNMTSPPDIDAYLRKQN